MCSKCRTCFDKIDELAEQSPQSAVSINEREQEQRRHDDTNLLSPTSPPTKSIANTTKSVHTETSSKSTLSTAAKSASGSVRRCRVVVADDGFSETVDALVSQHFTRQPEEENVNATSGRDAKPPPIARKEISIGVRDDELQRRNVGIQCVLPTPDTSKSRIEYSPPPSPKTIFPTESKNSTDSVRMDRRSSIGREPDLVVAHVTSAASSTGTVEDNAYHFRSVEEFLPRDSFHRKPDLIETGVNTDFVRIVKNEPDEDADKFGMNVHKDAVTRQSMPTQTDSISDDGELSKQSEVNLVSLRDNYVIAYAASAAAADDDESVTFIDSSKSVGVRSNQEPNMTPPSRILSCIHTETQTDICGPVMMVSMCSDVQPDTALLHRGARVNDLESNFEDVPYVTEISNDADCNVTCGKRSASKSAMNSMNFGESSDWSVSSAVQMNADDGTSVMEKDEVRELFRGTSSPQYRGTIAEARLSAVVRMPPTGRVLWKERDDELWMLSYLDLQISRQPTIDENTSRFVRKQFDRTTTTKTALAKCSVCSGSRLRGDRVLDNATPEVTAIKICKETCDVACNTPSVTQSAMTETATITDDVTLRPLTVETGCDPLRIDACEISLRLGEWSETIPSEIVSERKVKAAENEISSVTFVNVTSSLLASRTETKDVACETDFTLHSELSATISDSPFRNAHVTLFQRRRMQHRPDTNH